MGCETTHGHECAPELANESIDPAGNEIRCPLFQVNARPWNVSAGHGHRRQSSWSPWPWSGPILPNIMNLMGQWDSDPNYSYGYFVIPIALAILWHRRGLLDASMLPLAGGASSRCWPSWSASAALRVERAIHGSW